MFETERAAHRSSLERAVATGAVVLPDYDGACISAVVPTILNRGETDGADRLPPPEWMPREILDAEQVVLLVLDGLGWEQLAERKEVAPVLCSMRGGPITSVAPTTTATALSSIVTGLAPCEHGLVGYRIHVGDDEVLNVLRWTTASGDAMTKVPPRSLQRRTPFLGKGVPVVSRAEFHGTGFTEAHLPGVRLAGWRVPSSMAVEVGQLLAAGERFIYAYYDGIDKVAHERGLGAHYLAELRFADRLVEDLLSTLTPGAGLVVIADHGQVEVLDPPIVLPQNVAAGVRLLSGEGRFRWLHVHDGALKDVLEACTELFGDAAVVATRTELIESGTFGGPLEPEAEERLGDVALIATAPIAFFDPADTGEMKLVARHGSLTPAEMYVPLLVSSE